ncbi:putative adenine-specific DNA-methyltransferase [Brevibacillus borstelensis AK1]|uniref:Methyltransferase n=1 Tax=Brevibacillus borstelensis AK1 TaxID=1300222 RepID=M8DMJ2_9BACL|nr:site-specific DNA-methyltransferase [Brevibacillus borstelensis]EMT54687.1 putative adenine-specific DNA-methyltransferase [Brevibacillus borstelensis AK1]
MIEASHLEETRVDDKLLEDSRIVFHHGDAFDFLNSLDSNQVQLVITSPPYNVGKEYETKTSIEKYLETQEKIIEQLIRVTSDTGSICWQVGNYIENGEVYPLDMYYYKIFKKHGLQLRNRIIWHFGHGLHATKRFSGRYETILWFTKTDQYVFNLDPVRIPSKYPGKRGYRGKNKGKPTGNPMGKNPSDIWELLQKEWETGLWDIPNVKANHVEKTIHPCQFPVELVERCVLALSNEGDWILDPFAGVASSLIASVKNGRKAIGIEKEKEYIEVGTERIKAFEKNELRVRPLGTEVHKPRGKVAQVPEEWKLKK